jgi:flagellar biogenesis protein FliO
MLVRVRDKTVLLGVTPQSMQFLTDIDCGAAAWEEAAVQSGLDDAASAGERAR